MCKKRKLSPTYCSCDVGIIFGSVNQGHVTWQRESSQSSHVHCNSGQVTWLLFGQANSHACAPCDQRTLPWYHGVKHCVGNIVHEIKDFKHHFLNEEEKKNSRKKLFQTCKLPKNIINKLVLYYSFLLKAGSSGGRGYSINGY